MSACLIHRVWRWLLRCPIYRERPLPLRLSRRKIRVERNCGGHATDNSEPHRLHYARDIRIQKDFNTFIAEVRLTTREIKVKGNFRLFPHYVLIDPLGSRKTVLSRGFHPHPVHQNRQHVTILLISFLGKLKKIQ